MFTRNIISLCLYSVLGFVDTARILAVFPTPSISHHYVFRPLLHELVRRGHEVTLVTTDPAFPKGQAPSNLTEIDVHDLAYKIWEDVLKVTNDGNNDILYQFKGIMRVMKEVFEGVVTTDEVQNIINNRKGQFDLLLIEAYLKPLLVFTHIFKIPTIQISSLGGLNYNYEVVGASAHPFIYPTLIETRLYNLSYVEKIQQLYKRWQFDRMFAEMEDEYDEVLQRLFGHNTPLIRDLHQNVDMLFLNVHTIWADNQPVPPTLVFIGGMHNHPVKELPKDLSSLLDGSKNGVIYFSLGTNIIPSTSLPSNKFKIIKKVLSQLPYDVIWKWDQDTMANKTENIKLYKWVPQSDLLRHPKIKVFITQAGLQSTDEAIDAGVPLIGLPMFADQWYNAEKYPRHKIGVKLDLASLTEEQFKEAIENVITDKSYRENIERLRAVMRDEAQRPLDRAVWWAEYVVRHRGAKHLRAAGANVSNAQYFELEFIAIAVLIILSVLSLFFLTFNVTKRSLMSRTKFKLKSS